MQSVIALTRKAYPLPLGYVCIRVKRGGRFKNSRTAAVLGRRVERAILTILGIHNKERDSPRTCASLESLRSSSA